MATKKALSNLEKLNSNLTGNKYVNAPSWQSDFRRIDRNLTNYEKKQAERNNKITDLQNNPAMQYDLDSMQKEVNYLDATKNLAEKNQGYLYTDETGKANSVSDSKNALKDSGYNSVAEISDAISKKQKDINKYQREQNRINYELDALKDRMYDYYSKRSGVTKEELASADNKNSILKHNILSSNGNNKYFMTDDELSIYNYYLAKENDGLIESGTAQKYLDSIEDTLNQRYGGRIAEDYNHDNAFNTALEMLFGNVGLASGINGYNNFVGMEYNPILNKFGMNIETTDSPSALEYAGGIVREDLADVGNIPGLDISLGQMGYDVTNVISNMIPSIGASIVSESVLPGSGAFVGTTLMGASAAGNEYQNMLYQGYSEEVSRKEAELVGISEAVLQYALGGIGKLSGISKKGLTEGIKNATRRIIAEYGLEMGSEALEEGLQEALAPYIKAYATGEIPESAKFEDIAYSALLGAINAGIFNVGELGKGQYIPFTDYTQNTSTNNNGTTNLPNGPNMIGTDNTDRYTGPTDITVTSPFTDDGKIDTDTEETKAPMSDIETSIENADKDLKEQVSSLKYDSETKKAIELGYDKELGISVNDYVKGVAEGVEYGYSQYPINDVDPESTFASLPDSVKNFAYNLGKNVSVSTAAGRDTNIKNNANGNTGRRIGTVRSEGISLSELQESFNDTQKIAYKLLSGIAEATGVDIVLYRSEPNASGKFTANQGYFKKSNETTIYIDVNAGLKNARDLESKIRGLGKFTMLRTFGHESLHFAEHWNPTEYNTFRTLVFETLNERGENAENLVKKEMLSSGMSFDRASREVIAEGLSDILADERTAQKFGEKLYGKDKNLFQKFVDALKKFIANLKAYFKDIISRNPNKSKAAQALSEEVDGEIRYLDKILDGYVNLMHGAVENMQSNYAVAENTTTDTEVKATEETKAEPTVKEIDVNALMNGITEAQGKANKTGEEQSVKLSDYAKKDNTSNEDTRVKELLDNAKKILEENGSTAVEIKLLDVPHEKSLQEKNAIKTAEEFKYELSVNPLALLSSDLQIDYKDTVNGDFGLWIIKNSSDWNKLDADMKKHHDYKMEHYIDGDVHKGRLPDKDEESKNIKSLTDYAKVLSKGESEETNWYKTVTDPAVYGPYINKPISYIKAANGYYHLGLYGEPFDYEIDKDDFWGNFYAFHEYDSFSISKETAEKIHEAGIKDREALTKSAYTDEAPIHLGDNKSVFERVIEPFYFLLGVSKHSKTYGEDGMLPYNLVDIADHGNDLYVRFRDMPIKHNGRGFDLKLADFKNYTAQEIIDSVDKAYGKDALGTNFTNGIKDYYKQFVKSEKPKKESKPEKTVEKNEPKVEVAENPSVVTGDIDFKATKVIAEKIVKQTKKTDRTVGTSSDGYFFIGNTAVAVMVDEATYNEFEESERGLSFKATNTRPFVEYGKLATTKLGGKAYKYITSDNVKSFYFEDGNTKYLVNEKFIKAFSGYDFYYVPNDFKLAVKDSDGNFIGIICSMKISKEINTEKLELAKIKGFNQETPTPKLDTEVAAEEETVEANVDDTSYEEIEDTSSKYPGTSPSDKTANALIETYLSKGQKFTSNDLYKICDETFGGTQAEGKYDRKDAYDAMELAVNKRIVEVMKGYNTGKVDNALEGLRRMQALLDLLPTQTVRTEEQEQYQQFSTPPNIAYIASWVANINSKDHMMEPSAGIGGIASFAKSWGAMVTVNELSKRRYGVLKAMGFDNMFNENAEHINNILPDSIQPSVVVMNPPFSSTAGRTKTNKTSNAELHINSALDRLGEGGRLVAILGRGMADDKYSKYWNKIRENYTIRANISIDGSNYKKYGTTFDIQLVVIDKIGPQKGKTFTAVYEDLSKVPSALEGIRNERSTEVKFSTIVASNQRDSVPAERDGAVSVPVDSAADNGNGSGALSNGIEQRNSGESGSNNLQPGVSDGVSEHNQLTDTQHNGNDKSDTENSVSKDRESDSETGSEVTGNDSTESTDERSGLGDDTTRSTEVGRSKERNDDGVFADYVMPKLPIKGSKPHPATLVESSAMSSVEMPPAVYKTHLPENVVKNNLSAEQMVTITYAGQSHEQKLPNGMRKGFFIGDGTGVGKGRQISGIILDNFEQGRKRAVWVSKNDKLYSDAVRDWTETTGRSAKEVYNFGKIKLGDKIDIKEGILFATYATIANEKGEKSRLNQIVDWLGKDFDGVIAFDEAHNMANAGGGSGAWGKKEGAGKALKSIELQNKLPNARVVYVSATGATEVSNLAYAERLGLWGEGTAFPNRNDFISKIGSAGLSAMELVVRDMKAMGVYVARSISYNGVSYDTVEHNLDGIQTEIYNTMCRAWQSVMDNVLKSLEETNANKNSNARKQARGQFYGAMQRFYNQVLTSMSMPSVIKDINNQLADGKSVVIQLVNTNQAQADREIANIKAENGSLDDMDLTPRGQLIEYLKNSFPVYLYEDVTDENGNTTSRLVKDSQGNPVVDKRAVKRRDELIALVNDMSIPDGPLEMLFDVFGTENVAEVTGRSRRVVPKKMENGSVHRVEESRTKAHTEADVAAFNEGKKRILVFSDAGGTGKSYHASRTVKNQQQRVHYVLQPGWSASNAVQGFGRTNRSNQSSAPIYKLVTTNIKGQKRFTSTIARRLDQLGALTKGQRDSGSGMFGAKDNLETDLAKDALREFYSRLIRNKIPGLDRYDIIKKLGLLNKFTDQYGSFGLDDSAARDMGLFLNRILSLEVDEQNRVFDEFTNIYDFMLEKAIQEGTLDTGMENVKADKIEIIDSEVISKQKGTGAETKYVQAKVYTKPRVLKSIGDVKDYRSGFVGIYKTENEEYKAVYRIADKTTPFGDVQKQYLVYGPNLAKHSVWIENTLNAKATLVPEKEWNTVWAEEVKNVPEYNEEIKHMLTGALLPIWDRLPSEGNTKVQRITADNGESYLGRIIESNIIDGILRVFGASKTNEKFTVDSVKNGALKEGKIYNLTYHNAKIKRSRVSNEWRLEYIQPKNQFSVSTLYPGIIEERISFQYRFFIPQNEQGEKIISKILENNPVAYVGDEDTQYQSREYLDEDDNVYSYNLDSYLTYEDKKAVRRVASENSRNEANVLFKSKSGDFIIPSGNKLVYAMLDKNDIEYSEVKQIISVDVMEDSELVDTIQQFVFERFIKEYEADEEYAGTSIEEYGDIVRLACEKMFGREINIKIYTRPDYQSNRYDGLAGKETKVGRTNKNSYNKSFGAGDTGKGSRALKYTDTLDDVQYQSRDYLDDDIEKEYWEVASMIAELYDSYDPYDYMDQMNGYEDTTIAEQLKNGDFSIIDRVQEEYEEYTDAEKKIADDIIRRAEALKPNKVSDSEGRVLSEGQIKFFGRSEIRDKNNNLLRVFHGTSKKFTVFDTSLSGFKNGAVLGRGIYLTDNKNDAFDWGGGSRVIEAYANITNPLYADERLDSIIAEHLHDVFPVSLFEDYTRYDGVKVTAKESQENLINKVLSGTNGDFIHEVMLKYSKGDKYNYDKSTDLLMEYGYDGIVKKHGRDLEVVVFDSNQVKEITNLNPTKNNDIQYQSRNDEALTNTEVLEMAAEKVEALNLTDGEKFALETFKKNLTELDNLEDERKEQGRLYKEQQFGKSVDKDKATETLNRMHILDEKIKKTEDALLSLEEKEVLKRVLEKARKVIEAEDRKKSQEMLKRYKERKKNAESIKKYRDRIKEDVEELSKWITRPDVKAGKMVPDAIRDSVIVFLTSIDFTSKRQLRGGAATKADAEFVKNIEKLKEAIKGNIDLQGMYSGYNDLPEDFMDNLQGFIDSVRKLSSQNNGEYVINQMTAEELKELSNLVRIIKKFVTMMNSFHNNAMYQHVAEAGQSDVNYLSRCGKASNVGELSNFVFWENIRPAFAWERFGPGGKSIYKELVDGQGQLAINAKQVAEFAKSAYTEAEVKEWSEKGETFTIGNDKVFIPYAYMMGIYELSKQEDSLVHILSEKGGIRIATFTKEKTKYSDDGHLIDRDKLDEIIGKLSPRQKEVADNLQNYIETVGSKWGNYVSVKRFGIEQFTKKHYYPINSDGRHLDNNMDEMPNNASLYALLNMSFTKNRIEGANNRIVVYNIFDVFANHMASMAQYNALALPVLDALKWFNYKEVIKDEATGRVTVGRSIKEELAKVYGVPEETRPGKGSEGYAVTFIKGIIKAFNGTETQGTPQDTLGLKFLHQHNMAQIAFNLRVVIQQPMSILRAGLILDYSSIMKGMKMSPNEIKETLKELNDHNGIAVWKNVLGFYDTNISRGLTALIKHDKATLEKINEVGLIGAEYADKVTWAAMWKACKIEVMKKGTKENDPKFFDKVNDLFNEVIYKTQVVDSVLTKTEFMRSKGYWARAMSSFMSEAVTTASTLTDAIFNYNMDLQRGMSKSQAWVKNKDKIAKAIIAYCISAIFLAAVQAVMDAFRDDDDEPYIKKWFDAFIGNVIDELMPFNKLPIMSDFYDLAKELLSKLGVDTYGNPPTSIFMQYWDSLVNGVAILHDKIEGSNKGYTWYGGIKKLLQAASSITGAPLGNVTREAITFWNTTAGSFNENLKIKSYESGNHEMNKYFRAVDDNDFAGANNIYNEMVKDNKKALAEKREKEGKLELSDEELEKEVKSNIKSAITTHYKDLYVEAYQKKDDKAMAEIRQKLYKTGLYGSVDDVIKACNKWLKDYK